MFLTPHLLNTLHLTPTRASCRVPGNGLRIQRPAHEPDQQRHARARAPTCRTTAAIAPLGLLLARSAGHGDGPLLQVHGRAVEGVLDDQGKTLRTALLGAGRPGDLTRVHVDARTLWRAVAELPQEQRVLVEGVYREGRTYQEVADATGVPLGTLKRRLRESLAVLRAQLGPEMEDG